MSTYVLTHLNDAVLLRDLDALVSQKRGAMAAVIAHLGEVDARRLYLPAGYPSMYEYCLRKLHWSEQTALKRLRVARTARQFPVIFAALAAGRLHLTAVVLLAPYLTADNADELLAAAAHRTRAEIEELLAQWFPKPDVPARLRAIALASGFPRLLSPECVTVATLSPGTVSSLGDTAQSPACASQEALTSIDAQLSLASLSPKSLSPGTVSSFGDTDSRAAQTHQLAPLTPERFALQFTIGKHTYEKLRCVQALLGHQVASGDVVQVFDRALDTLKEQLEKQKFAATAKPRRRAIRHNPGRHRSSANSRYIPAPVKRAVWARDGGQCTFVNAAGERCHARRMLEFDHIDPVARGGRATVDGVWILCRGHNQYEADRRFGAGFMRQRRAKPRRATGTAQAKETTLARETMLARETTEVRDGAPIATAPARSEAQEQARDVMAGLRALGFRASEARRAIEFGETLMDPTLDVTLEERMRAALKFLCPTPG